MADSLGKLTVEIDADKDRLDSATKQAKSDLQGVGDEGQKAGVSVTKGMGRAGKSIQNATQGARDFVGSLTETIGIVTGIAGVVAFLASGFLNASKAVADFRKGVEQTKDSLEDQIQTARIGLSQENDLTKTQVQLLNEERDAINEVAEALDNTLKKRGGNTLSGEAALNVTSFLFGVKTNQDLVNEAEESIDIIRRKFDQLRELRTEQSKQFLESIEERVRSIRLSQIEDPIERAREVAEAEIEAARKVAKEKGVLDTRQQAELEDAIRERSEREIRGIRERQRAQEQADKQAEKNRLEQIRERERAERESAERAARSAREAFQRELSGLANNLFDTAGQNLTSRLDTIVDELRNVTQSVGRR